MSGSNTRAKYPAGSLCKLDVMKVTVFGKMMFRIILIFNLMFIVFSIVAAIANGTSLSWHWFANQYPGLLLWPTALGIVAFLSFRIKTLRVPFEDRSEVAEDVLSNLNKMHYQVVWEKPAWSVFKQKNKLKRIVPGFEDTCLVETAQKEFELTGYAEDLRVLERLLAA